MMDTRSGCSVSSRFHNLQRHVERIGKVATIRLMDELFNVLSSSRAGHPGTRY